MATRNPDGTFIVNGKILYGKSPITMDDLVDLFPAIGKIQAIVAQAVAAGPRTRKSTKPKALPEHVAKILTLHKEGYTNKQIGDHLGINGQSVNGVIASAKRQGHLPAAAPATKGAVASAVGQGLVGPPPLVPMLLPALKGPGPEIAVGIQVPPLVESRFVGSDGHVFWFTLEKDKETADLKVARPDGGGTALDVPVMPSRREVDRAFREMKIRKRSSVGLWLQGCILAMKGARPGRGRRAALQRKKAEDKK